MLSQHKEVYTIIVYPNSPQKFCQSQGSGGAHEPISPYIIIISTCNRRGGVRLAFDSLIHDCRL